MRDRSSIPAAYHLLSIRQKQEHAMDAARDRPIRCPACETALMPSDLLAHVEQRCAGPREPGRGARWLGWREAYAIVPRGTLARWARQGIVRVTGSRREQRFLQRDLVVAVARSRLAARRRARAR